jgi:UDP-glucose:(glucosyl)LPS alpha-1,2-glucosyltransferase
VSFDMSKVKYNFVGNDTPKIEKNELNVKARGGTELMQERLANSLPADLLDKFQIIPSRVRNIDPNKKAILWLHDLPNDPESQHLKDANLRKRFSKIVAVSDWQMQLYNLMLGVPYEECVVLKNAITPIEIKEKKYDGTIRIIYHTTPHRGLEILVPVFEKLCEQYDNIQLDVFSSFSIYGWEQRDEPYRGLFERCKAHPKINYHGAVSNERIREELKKSHIFAYPSTWPETSCLAAIEAMSAMNVVVCPNYAALPETCAGFANMYQWMEDKNKHAARFAAVLEDTIKDYSKSGPDEFRLRYQKQYYDMIYNWDSVRSKQWEGVLKQLS